MNLSEETNWEQLVRIYNEERDRSDFFRTQCAAARVREQYYREALENLLFFPGDDAAEANARDVLDRFAPQSPALKGSPHD